MTSTIPVEWLVPYKIANGYKFQCSTNLRDLVLTNRATSFFRQIVTLIEQDYHLENFHLKIQHNRKKIDITKDIWETKIVPRHKEKIEYLGQLLKQTALVSACFTERHLQQEIQKGVIGN